MFGITMARKYRELEKLLSLKNEEIISLRKTFQALQADIATLMEIQLETHRHYGRLLSQQKKETTRKMQDRTSLEPEPTET